MKKIIFILIQLFLAGTLVAQDEIEPKKDACAYCNMFILSKKFMAITVDNDDNTKKFDAIECLMNHLKTEGQSIYKEILVSDYDNDDSLIDAKTAFYLKSKGITSPMGANLSAFSSKESAMRMQSTKGGEVYDWKGLILAFNNSKFGAVEHPFHHHNTPDAYAPVGVMGDHLHHKGGFMLSTTYMLMSMDGNLNGKNEINDLAIYQGYMAAPQSMRMEMFMIGAMYAPTNKLTLMLMQNFQRNEMDLRSMMGMYFTTRSAGISDFKINALYGLSSKPTGSMHLNAEVSIPVGSIKERYDTPMVEDMKLPYPMQLGSGTVDVSIGGTYKGSASAFSWGVQPIATIRTGQNSEGYRWGNEFRTSTWLSYRLTNWISLSTQLSGKKQFKMSGQDDQLNPMMVTTADSMNTGFTKLNTYFGMNLSLGKAHILRNLKGSFSYGIPVYQKVKGIQMEETNSILMSLRYAI